MHYQNKTNFNEHHGIPQRWGESTWSSVRLENQSAKVASIVSSSAVCTEKRNHHVSSFSDLVTDVRTADVST